MTLTQLRYVLAVREHGTMSAAARACHVSQPSLSAGVRQLEEELGVDLFERSARGTVATSEGKQLLDQAAAVIAEVDQLQEMAEASASGVLEGDFQLGVIPTVGPYLLPRVLRPLERAYRELELGVHEGMTDDLLAEVRAHNLDAAIIALPYPVPDDLRVIEVYREPFLVALPPDDHLAERASLDLDELDTGDLLLLDEGHCLREHALEVCQTPASALREQFRGASLETIRQFVIAGWGISLFPALATEREDEVIVRPLAKPAYRDIALVARKSYPDMASVEALADFLHAQVADVAERLGRGPDESEHSPPTTR